MTFWNSKEYAEVKNHVKKCYIDDSFVFIPRKVCLETYRQHCKSLNEKPLNEEDFKADFKRLGWKFGNKMIDGKNCPVFYRTEFGSIKRERTFDNCPVFYRTDYEE